MGDSWIEMRTGRDPSALSLLQVGPIPWGTNLLEQIDPIGYLGLE